MLQSLVVDYIRTQAKTVKVAPGAFIAALLLGAIFGGGAILWLFNYFTLPSLAARIALLQEEVSAYKDKLHNASPSEAAATIKDLQGQVEALRYRENQLEAEEWPALTSDQQKQWADVLGQFSSRPHHIVISELDSRSGAFVDSLKKTFKMAGLPDPEVSRTWSPIDGIEIECDQRVLVKAFAELLCQVGPVTDTRVTPIPPPN
jgi:hypothetical protein